MRTKEDICKDFPLLMHKMNNQPLIYLDNSATTQKPKEVIQAICDYYSYSNANPHRGAYALSVEATDIYEYTRNATRAFINARLPQEIIFTKNATEALNLVAYSYGLMNVRTGDEIVISIAEHHSNLVPWQMVAKAKGATLKYMYLEKDGRLSVEEAKRKITKKTKIVAVTEVSNVLGIINPVKEIAAVAHENGAVILVDGSQSAAHMPVDVQDMDCDFFAFSGHKLLSPMGIGVLYGKEALLDAMVPFLRGGDMIEYVTEQETTFAELAQKFEAGTQNVGAAAGLRSAIEYLEKTGFDTVRRIEQDLVSYALPLLHALPEIEMYGCDVDPALKTGIITFNVKDVHPHDVATILDSFGIAVRAGHHCAQPLLKYLGQNAACRASFYLYNKRADVDRLLDALKEVRKVMHL